MKNHSATVNSGISKLISITDALMKSLFLKAEAQISPADHC